jgi:hypothetical protein
LTYNENSAVTRTHHWHATYIQGGPKNSHFIIIWVSSNRFQCSIPCLKGYLLPFKMRYKARHNYFRIKFYAKNCYVHFGLCARSASACFRIFAAKFEQMRITEHSCHVSKSIKWPLKRAIKHRNQLSHTRWIILRKYVFFLAWSIWQYLTYKIW